MKQSIKHSNRFSYVEEKHGPIDRSRRVYHNQSVKQSINTTFVDHGAILDRSSSSIDIKTSLTIHPSIHQSFDGSFSCSEPINHSLDDSFQAYMDESYDFDQDDAINVSKMMENDEPMDLSEVEDLLFRLSFSQSLEESFDFSVQEDDSLNDSFNLSTMSPAHASIDRLNTSESRSYVPCPWSSYFNSTNHSTNQSVHQSGNKSPVLCLESDDGGWPKHIDYNQIGLGIVIACQSQKLSHSKINQPAIHSTSC